MQAALYPETRETLQRRITFQIELNILVESQEKIAGAVLLGLSRAKLQVKHSMHGDMDPLKILS